MSGRDYVVGFDGQLIWPTDEQFEAARLIDNSATDSRPALIARARDEDDVAAVIRYVRQRRLPLAVRSGGHSIAGHSTGEGVVVLDLGLLKGLVVDEASRTAWAGPGVRAGDYTSAAYGYGLATSFGDTGSVGLGGLIVGGGIGWLVRSHGLTIDNLVAAEVITADGVRLTASADENADLFWALRGGGGNFGVVTRYLLALHPISMVLHGSLLMPARREILAGMLALGLAAPDELTLMPSVMAIPPMDELPAAEHGRLGLFLDLLWSGPIDAGKAVIEPFRALGPVLLDTVAAKPYPAIYRPPSDDRGAWTAQGIFIDDLDGTVGVIERHLAMAPSADCLAHFRVLGGAAGRVPADATAYGWRDRQLLLWIICAFDAPDADRRPHEAWVEGLRTDLLHHGGGNFLSFMPAANVDEVAQAYPPATWARLREVKRRYDPDNLFRHNHNIPPAAD